MEAQPLPLYLHTMNPWLHLSRLRGFRSPKFMAATLEGLQLHLRIQAPDFSPKKTRVGEENHGDIAKSFCKRIN